MPTTIVRTLSQIIVNPSAAATNRSQTIREIDVRYILGIRFPELSDDDIDGLLSMMRDQAAEYNRDGLASAGKFRGLAPWQERRARELIEANVVLGISVDEIATQCTYSRCHFSRAFKASTGVTPHQYLLNLKIEKSKILLTQENINICDIASECGFSDSSHFCRVFSRLVGFTPSYWRRVQFGFK